MMRTFFCSILSFLGLLLILECKSASNPQSPSALNLKDLSQSASSEDIVQTDISVNTDIDPSQIESIVLVSDSDPDTSTTASTMTAVSPSADTESSSATSTESTSSINTGAIVGGSVAGASVATLLVGLLAAKRSGAFAKGAIPYNDKVFLKLNSKDLKVTALKSSGADSKEFNIKVGKSGSENPIEIPVRVSKFSVNLGSSAEIFPKKSSTTLTGVNMQDGEKLLEAMRLSSNKPVYQLPADDNVNFQYIIGRGTIFKSYYHLSYERQNALLDENKNQLFPPSWSLIITKIDKPW